MARAVSVTAGPGTGKTGTLTARIAYLINGRGVKSSEITAVTFTNKAAAELKTRLEKALGGKKAVRSLHVGTFHSLCLNLLRKHGFERVPAAEEMLLDLARDIVKECELAIKPAEFLSILSLKKSGGSWVPQTVRLKGDSDDGARADGKESVSAAAFDPDQFSRAAEEYQKRLEAEGACDFDDLLLETLKLLETEEKREIRKSGFDYLLVDEFQDVNLVQFRLIQAWNQGGRELFVIGDPDQSIYGFRGSDPACFAQLKASFPSMEAITLTRNYRSVPSVLIGAGAVISKNPGPERNLIPAREEGAKIRLATARSGMSEGIFIAREINRLIGGIDMLDAQEKRITERLTGFSDIAVLYRTHRQASLLEKCLQREGIPYLVAGRDDYLSNEKVRGTIGFFRYLLNPQDSFSAKLSCRLLWAKREEEFERAVKEWSALTVKGKPDALLEKWIQERKWEGDPEVEKLLKTSCLYRTMEEFLKDLAFGKEGDLRRPGKKQYRSDAVTLMTLHGAKGLEFPAVILCGVRKGLIPLEWKAQAEPETYAGERPQNDADKKLRNSLEEERRLFYVGMTRAKEQLILVTGEEESEFLSELPESCIEREEAEAPKRAAEAEQLSLFEWIDSAGTEKKRR